MPEAPKMPDPSRLTKDQLVAVVRRVQASMFEGEDGQVDMDKDLSGADFIDAVNVHLSTYNLRPGENIPEQPELALDCMAKAIEKLRTDFLFGVEENSALAPKASAYFLQALALLNAADSAAQLAQLEQVSIHHD